VFRYPFTSKTTFDPLADLTYIMSLSGYAFGVVVRTDSPWATFRTFCGRQGNSDKFSYGTPGVGTTLHLTMERHRKQRASRWTHVPFPQPRIPPTLCSADISICGGRQRLARWSTAGGCGSVIWSDKRSKKWPNVPTLKEAGSRWCRTRRSAWPVPRAMKPKVSRSCTTRQEGSEEPVLSGDVDEARPGAVSISTTRDYRAFAERRSPEQKQLNEELGIKPE